MEKIKKILFITSIIIILFSSNLTCQVNHLVPCFSFSEKLMEIDILKESNEYYEIVEEIINKNINEDYIVEFIKYPSFSPESAFTLNQIDEYNFEISAIFFQESIWYSEKRDSVKINIFKRNIDNILANKIDSMFKLFIEPIPDILVYNKGEDGTTYYFKKQENNIIKCGEAWSPDKDNILGDLVSICEIIMSFTCGENININSIIERIDVLCKRVEGY